MRISDWSSDVCSSDLVFHRQRQFLAVNRDAIGRDADVVFDIPDLDRPVGGRLEAAAELAIDPPRAIGLGGGSEGRDRGERAQQVWQIGRASCRERVCQYV